MPFDFGSVIGNMGSFGTMPQFQNVSGGAGANPTAQMAGGGSLPSFLKNESNNAGLPTPKQRVDQTLVNESRVFVSDTLKESRSNPDSIHYPTRVNPNILVEPSGV